MQEKIYITEEDISNMILESSAQILDEWGLKDLGNLVGRGVNKVKNWGRDVKDGYDLGVQGKRLEKPEEPAPEASTKSIPGAADNAVSPDNRSFANRFGGKLGNIWDKAVKAKNDFMDGWKESTMAAPGAQPGPSDQPGTQENPDLKTPATTSTEETPATEDSTQDEKVPETEATPEDEAPQQEKSLPTNAIDKNDPSLATNVAKKIINDPQIGNKKKFNAYSSTVGNAKSLQKFGVKNVDTFVNTAGAIKNDKDMVKASVS